MVDGESFFVFLGGNALGEYFGPRPAASNPRFFSPFMGAEILENDR